ncbi:G5 domain-containing protein [Serinibacter salmoneus]|uniref:Uncharacterized protein DUF348 n=1 Tax=Serinibacter salmoneus TaxID=556530 RepID=A0A2A9D2K6_9MICO|nr:G5 domain-containing protein [Serinibacter salmoneus]PFG20893.1 uncharacterized protein DUF348 [Serinibacter salmoneus]
MTDRRSVRKGVLGAGVLTALVAATGGVVVASTLEEGSLSSLWAADEPAVSEADEAADVRTSSLDIPLDNPALAEEDVVALSAASRSEARAALADGEGVALSVQVDGETHQVVTDAETLAAALEEAGIAVGWDDTVSHALDAAPEDGAEVTIGRASTEYVTEQVITEYDTEERETDDLLVGETRVVQKGFDGDARITSQVLTVDGKEVSRTQVMSAEATAAVTEIIEVGTREPAPVVASGSSSSSSSSSSGSSSSGSSGSSGSSASAPTSAQYTLSQFMSAGVINWGGYKFTYYSQQVLPGGGLDIPGRHVNAGGYVADGDGYIVLANGAPKGTIINTPFGYQGKVYDRGTYGNHYDVYIR